MQCTYEEMAAVLKISKRQFVDRMNRDQDLTRDH